MAKETGQESKLAEQDDPLYKARLSIGLEHLSSVFGHLLARVLVAFAIALLVFLAVSFVTGLIWYLSPIFSANDKLSTADRRDLVQGFASVAQAAAVGLAGAVGLVGLFFTWRSLEQARLSQVLTQENTQRTLELTEQGQITERFTRAIDQLGATDDKTGNPQREVRLGGIYALERIDKESPERAYHSTVMEVLTAYVRGNSRWKPEEASTPTSTSNEDAEQDKKGVEQAAEPTLRRLPTDVQAILDVLQRREEERVPEKHRVLLDLQEAYLFRGDLQEANLEGANLQGANLQGAILIEANLQGADLRGADLQGAKLQGANLQKANLQEGANLQGAILTGADFQRAWLQEANLEGANLFSANFQSANLFRADLQGANLFRAELQAANLQRANLRGADFRGATNLYMVNYIGADLQGATMPDGSKHP